MSRLKSTLVLEAGGNFERSAGAPTADGVKHQAPTTKLQRNPKQQVPKECRAAINSVWRLRASLELGCWSLVISINTSIAHQRSNHALPYGNPTSSRCPAS